MAASVPWLQRPEVCLSFTHRPNRTDQETQHTEDSTFVAWNRRPLPAQILEFWVECGVLRIDRGPAINWLRLSGKSSQRFERLGIFSRAMAESKLLAPELSDAESMGDETVRFQELLLQVRPDWTFGNLGV